VLKVIEARDIQFSYRGRAVLKGATLSLGTGELVCLLGANGAGKSTLLKILLGLLKPQAGKVSLGGTAMGDIDRRSLARQVAYVPQTHTAPFPYTVREVALMGRLPATGLLRAAGRAISVPWIRRSTIWPSAILRSDPTPRSPAAAADGSYRPRPSAGCAPAGDGRAAGRASD